MRKRESQRDSKERGSREMKHQRWTGWRPKLARAPDHGLCLFSDTGITSDDFSQMLSVPKQSHFSNSCLLLKFKFENYALCRGLTFTLEIFFGTYTPWLSAVHKTSELPQHSKPTSVSFEKKWRLSLPIAYEAHVKSVFPDGEMF